MRKIAHISDIHTGSVFGLAFPEWTTPTGETIGANPAQKKLYAYWGDFTRRIDEHDSDTIVNTGECCEGNNKKEFGRSLTTAELNQQIDHCTQLLEPVVRNRTYIGCKSSKYHNALEISLDEVVARNLVGTAKKVHFLGNMGVVHFEGTDVKAHICHSSGAAMMYRESVAARESIFQDAAEALKLNYHVDLFMRGHWHWFHMQANASRRITYAPSWKILFDWDKNPGMYSRFLPDLGGTFITIDGKDIEIKEKLYPHIQLLEEPQTV